MTEFNQEIFNNQLKYLNTKMIKRSINWVAL